MTYEQEASAMVQAFMKARIERVYGKHSRLEETPTGYRFRIVKIRLGVPTTLQSVELDGMTEEEATQHVYELSNRKAAADRQRMWSNA